MALFSRSALLRSIETFGGVGHRTGTQIGATLTASGLAGAATAGSGAAKQRDIVEVYYGSQGMPLSEMRKAPVWYTAGVRWVYQMHEVRSSRAVVVGGTLALAVLFCFFGERWMGRFASSAGVDWAVVAPTGARRIDPHRKTSTTDGGVPVRASEVLFASEAEAAEAK